LVLVLILVVVLMRFVILLMLLVGVLSFLVFHVFCCDFSLDCHVLLLGLISSVRFGLGGVLRMGGVCKEYLSNLFDIPLPTYLVEYGLCSLLYG